MALPVILQLLHIVSLILIIPLAYASYRLRNSLLLSFCLPTLVIHFFSPIDLQSTSFSSCIAFLALNTWARSSILLHAAFIAIRFFQVLSKWHPNPFIPSRLERLLLLPALLLPIIPAMTLSIPQSSLSSSSSLPPRNDPSSNPLCPPIHPWQSIPVYCLALFSLSTLLFLLPFSAYHIVQKWKRPFLPTFSSPAVLPKPFVLTLAIRLSLFSLLFFLIALIIPGSLLHLPGLDDTLNVLDSLYGLILFTLFATTPYAASILLGPFLSVKPVGPLSPSDSPSQEKHNAPPSPLGWGLGLGFLPSSPSPSPLPPTPSMTQSFKGNFHSSSHRDAPSSHPRGVLFAPLSKKIPVVRVITPPSRSSSLSSYSSDISSYSFTSSPTYSTSDSGAPSFSTDSPSSSADSSSPSSDSSSSSSDSSSSDTPRLPNPRSNHPISSVWADQVESVISNITSPPPSFPPPRLSYA
ncbi:MAG: hypothetical protein DHS80DRAFT_21064 [Piptocephalis tieghemiana]|nr:MAG: hypothetical protein DHS80DRAFT_21064 [Piptocephalis tieghemiana]